MTPWRHLGGCAGSERSSPSATPLRYGSGGLRGGRRARGVRWDRWAGRRAGHEDQGTTRDAATATTTTTTPAATGFFARRRRGGPNGPHRHRRAPGPAAGSGSGRAGRITRVSLHRAPGRLVGGRTRPPTRRPTPVLRQHPLSDSREAARPSSGRRVLSCVVSRRSSAPPKAAARAGPGRWGAAGRRCERSEREARGGRAGAGRRQGPLERSESEARPPAPARLRPWTLRGRRGAS